MIFDIFRFASPLCNSADNIKSRQGYCSVPTSLLLQMRNSMKMERKLSYFICWRKNLAPGTYSSGSGIDVRVVNFRNHVEKVIHHLRKSLKAPYTC